MMQPAQLILAVILGFYFSSTVAIQFQSHESISSAAMTYLQEKMGKHQDFKISLDPLDRRLKLSACEQPLQGFTHKDTVKPGRLSVGVRCNSNRPWTIYNSARIKVFENVIILTQAVQRGEMITKDHLVLEKKEISNLRTDYFIQIEPVINHQATRNIRTGTVISPKHLTLPKWVTRGQKIIISAKSKLFDIQMQGLAMMDGKEGQRIRVKNTKSLRIIEATVVKPGMVAVNF